MQPARRDDGRPAPTAPPRHLRHPGWHRVKATAAPAGHPLQPARRVRRQLRPASSCGAPPPTRCRARRPAAARPDPPAPDGGGDRRARRPGPGGGTDPGPGAARPSSSCRASARAPAGRPVASASAGASCGPARRAPWRFRPAPPGYQGRLHDPTGTKGTAAHCSAGLPGRTWTCARRSSTRSAGRQPDIGTCSSRSTRALSAVRRSGGWKRAGRPGAWLGAVHVGRAGARCPPGSSAGRPVVQLRGVRKTPSSGCARAEGARPTGSPAARRRRRARSSPCGGRARERPGARSFADSGGRRCRRPSVASCRRRWSRAPAAAAGRPRAGQRRGPTQPDPALSARRGWCSRPSGDGGLPGPAAGGDRRRRDSAPSDRRRSGSRPPASTPRPSPRPDRRTASSRCWPTVPPLASSTADIAYYILAAHAVGADAAHVGSSNIDLSPRCSPRASQM